MSQKSDDRYRDEVLKRLLQTPPKPHNKKEKPKIKKKEKKANEPI